jgi:dihydrofolate reductase
MGKIVVGTRTSVDGFVADRDGDSSALYPDDGIEKVIERAKAAAGDRDVVVIGADVSQQALRAEVVDEIGVGIVLVLLGEGIRLFDRLGPQRVELERMRVTETPVDTDVRFRVKRQKDEAFIWD